MVDDLVLRDVHRRGLMFLDSMMRDNLIVNSDLSASANKFGEYAQMWDQYFEKIKGAKEKPSPKQARKYLQEMVTPDLEERIAEMYPQAVFDHIHIISKDPAPAAAWYVEMPGGKIAGESEARMAPNQVSSALLAQ